MLGKQIREQFLKFFTENDHTVVESSALVPPNDPTLLFTNAGMVQFKQVFTGLEKRSYLRATSSQKCVRAGGKHNDLENVGHTTRHHTFFEMLGNFSFGDYFKEKAVELAWEFLVDKMGLPKDKLIATIYKEDDESDKIWQKFVPKERIIRLGEKDNFWSMGDTGPCGPCSEIIMDQGKDVGCRRPTCSIECDCDRFLEIWNLVFMQYDRAADGSQKPLPRPSIDTGMGLERLAAVMQGVTSNYDCDLLRDIITPCEKLCGRPYGANKEDDISMRVIADHSRATAFLISDGVFPSNEGRGYVLRRIMRRAIRHAHRIGMPHPFFSKITGAVVDKMADAFPELKEKEVSIKKMVDAEEERFSETLERGLSIYKEETGILRKRKQTTIPGALVFKLYDTFGFPIDLTQNIAEEDGLSLDLAGFDRQMEKQRALARKSWTGGAVEEEQINPIYQTLEQGGEFTTFVGYDHEELKDQPVWKMVQGQEPVDEASVGQEVEILFRKTPFYGRAGGQVGDKGLIRGRGFDVDVLNCYRPTPNITVHKGRVIKGKVAVGDRASLYVEHNSRQPTRRHHTATHLLHAALRTVLGTHVKQSGSLVEPDRLRFDFTHFEPVTPEQIREIEDLTNSWIQQNYKVTTEVTSYDDAIKKGALAFFGEKYGDRVRMIKIGNISAELCGGTHVAQTGDIGLCVIESETGVAAGVRRITALTGLEALRYVQNQREEYTKVAAALRAQPGEQVEKLKKLQDSVKALEREVKDLKQKQLIAGAGAQEAMADKVREVKGVKLLVRRIDDTDPKLFRGLADNLKDKLKTAVVVLGGVKEGKAALLVSITKDLAGKEKGKLNASELITDMASLIGGRGGGRPDFAQAGGAEAQRLDEALAMAEELLTSKL